MTDMPVRIAARNADTRRSNHLDMDKDTGQNGIAGDKASFTYYLVRST